MSLYAEAVSSAVSSAQYRDGSCSTNKIFCHTNAICVENENKTRSTCNCREGFEGDGFNTCEGIIYEHFISRF